MNELSYYHDQNLDEDENGNALESDDLQDQSLVLQESSIDIDSGTCSAPLPFGPQDTCSTDLDIDEALRWFSDI